MPDAPTFRVREIQLLERPLQLRLPFRYGVVTLREATEAFVRVRVEGGGTSAWGTAADLLAPKWFDKDPALSDADNMEQLRDSLRTAASRYLDAGQRSTFGLSIAVREAGAGERGAPAYNGLVAGFGPATIDRAVLDAACRIAGVGFAQALRRNLPGIDLTALAPDLASFDSDRFLAGLRPAYVIEARHTVGMTDPLEAGPDLAGQPDDGLPVTLRDVAAAYGNRWFKVKVGGDLDTDLQRLVDIARVLDDATGGDYRVTLDGNEQYPDADAFARFVARLVEHRALGDFRARIALVEQPLDRRVALAVDVAAIDCPWPLIIDESDGSPDAFRIARERGYAGVSSKQCKGFYKALANAARCAAWNAEAASAAARDIYFISAEDLTCQGGIAVQQDLAIAAVLGVPHAERNGHHFGGPMPGATTAEQRAFMHAHPDLYEPWGDGARLRIHDGRLQLGSLRAPGFAHAADPAFDAMTPM